MTHKKIKARTNQMHEGTQIRKASERVKDVGTYSTKASEAPNLVHSL